MSDAPPPGGYPPQQPPQPPQPPPGGYGQPSYPPPAQPAPAAPPPGPPGGYQAPPPAAPPPGGYQPPPQYGQPTPPPGFGGPPPQPGYAPGAPMAAQGPAPKSSNSGCIKALIIGVIVVVVLGIVGTIGTVLLVGRAIEKTVGTADPGDYSAQVDECTVDDIGGLNASGTLTNKTNHRQAFKVTLQFLDGNTLISEQIDFVDSLEGGSTGKFSMIGFDANPPATVTCKITDVSYWGQ